MAKKETRAAEAREAPAEEFSEALAAFVLPYKNFMHKTWAAKILHNQAEQVNKDPEWLYEDGPPPPPEPAVLELLQPSSAIVGDVAVPCSLRDCTCAHYEPAMADAR